jgi:hypothetical protein
LRTSEKGWERREDGERMEQEEVEEEGEGKTYHRAASIFPSS